MACATYSAEPVATRIRLEVMHKYMVVSEISIKSKVTVDFKSFDTLSPSVSELIIPKLYQTDSLRKG